MDATCARAGWARPSPAAGDRRWRHGAARIGRARCCCSCCWRRREGPAPQERGAPEERHAPDDRVRGAGLVQGSSSMCKDTWSHWGRVDCDRCGMSGLLPCLTVGLRTPNGTAAIAKSARNLFLACVSYGRRAHTYGTRLQHDAFILPCLHHARPRLHCCRVFDYDADDVALPADKQPSARSTGAVGAAAAQRRPGTATGLGPGAAKEGGWTGARGPAASTSSYEPWCDGMGGPAAARYSPLSPQVRDAVIRVTLAPCVLRCTPSRVGRPFKLLHSLHPDFSATCRTRRYRTCTVSQAACPSLQYGKLQPIMYGEHGVLRTMLLAVLLRSMQASSRSCASRMSTGSNAAGKAKKVDRVARYQKLQQEWTKNRCAPAASHRYTPARATRTPWCSRAALSLRRAPTQPKRAQQPPHTSHPLQLHRVHAVFT